MSGNMLAAARLSATPFNASHNSSRAVSHVSVGSAPAATRRTTAPDAVIDLTLESSDDEAEQDDQRRGGEREDQLWLELLVGEDDDVRVPPRSSSSSANSSQDSAIGAQPMLHTGPIAGPSTSTAPIIVASDSEEDDANDQILSDDAPESNAASRHSPRRPRIAASPFRFPHGLHADLTLEDDNPTFHAIRGDDDDDEIVEVDSRGRPVPPRAQRLIAPIPRRVTDPPQFTMPELYYDPNANAGSAGRGRYRAPRFRDAFGSDNDDEGMAIAGPGPSTQRQQAQAHAGSSTAGAGPGPSSSSNRNASRDLVAGGLGGAIQSTNNGRNRISFMPVPTMTPAPAPAHLPHHHRQPRRSHDLPEAVAHNLWEPTPPAAVAGRFNLTSALERLRNHAEDLVRVNVLGAFAGGEPDEDNNDWRQGAGWFGGWGNFAGFNPMGPNGAQGGGGPGGADDLLPAFNALALHGGKKHPRAGFSYDFESVPDEKARWKAIPPSSVAASGSFSTLLGKRKARPEVVDLVDDSPPRGAARATSPSSDSASLPIFVCSGCEKPLSIGLDDPDERIWALRCGHLICGACLVRLGEPAPKTLIDSIDEVVTFDSKGKGKGKAKEVIDVKGKGKAREAPMSLEQVMELDDLLAKDAYEEDEVKATPAPGSSRQTRSGARRAADLSRSTMRKGRAAASDDDEPRSDGGVNMDDIDDDVDIPATHRPPPRSRATLARRSAATNASASTSTSAPAPLFRARRPARPRAPRVSNAKAGKKPRRGRKFETHHFRCPVSDCGREHARVLVGPTKAEARWRAAELDPKTGVAGEVPLYIGA